MYGIYANIGGILMVNVTIYGIHGSYGYDIMYEFEEITSHVPPTSSPFQSYAVRLHSPRSHRVSGAGDTQGRTRWDAVHVILPS